MQLQKEVISIQKQPNCEKKVCGFKKPGLKKMQSQRWQPRNGYYYYLLLLLNFTVQESNADYNAQV